MQFSKNAFHFLLAGILVLGFASNSYAVKYTSGCTVTQIQGPSDNGDVAQLMLKITLQVTNGGGTPPKVNDMTFNLLGFSEMSNVELWTSDQVDDFSGAILLGSQTPGASITITNGTANDDASNGAHYYWLTCDMNGSISPDVILDAEYVSGSYTTGPPTFTGSLNPAGFRLSDRSYTIGTGENYATVKDAADAIAQFVYDGAEDVFMELTANYTNPTEAIMTFTNHTGPAYITFRPEIGQTGKVTAGSTIGSDFIVLDGIQKLIFDGRPGGTGGSREWTIRNTDNVTPKNTFKYVNDAGDNKLTYVNIEGEPDGSSSLVFIGNTSGSDGNNNITVSYSKLSDLTTGGSAVKPSFGIKSNTTIAPSNDNIIIDNCFFVDFFDNATAFPACIFLESQTNNWQITNNSFYQTVSLTGVTSTELRFIRVSGNNHTVNGNFFGGTAPGCGGSPFTVSSGTAYIEAIIFSTGSGGNMTANGNTISNIDFNTTYAGTFPAFIGIYLETNANYTIGTNGNGNSFGNTTFNDDIVITVDDPGASSALGFTGIWNNSSGTSVISSNTFAGITVDGNKVGAHLTFIDNDLGTLTVENNTFGGSMVDNILVSSDSRLEAINNASASGITITNNTIQNCSQTFVGTSAIFNGITNSSGILMASNNTIKGVKSYNNLNSNVMINHSGGNSTISANAFQDISVLTSSSGSLTCVNVNSAGTSTISGNTLGSTSDNNMTIAVTGLNYGIMVNGGGTYTITNNTIQEFNLTDVGTNSSFLSIAVFAGNATVSGNTIQNIDLATTKTSGTYTSGIHFLSAGTSQIIRGNVVKNINLTTTSANGVKSRGIFLSVGDGLVENNFITGMTNTCTDPTAIMDGILETSGNWNLYNNVIILDNGANTNELSVNGINASSTGTGNIYHNTVKIAGTTTGGATNTHALLRTSASGTSIVKNNIFQNIRSGGTGKHYAENSVNTGTYTSDYNYVENITAANLCNYGGTDYNLAGWQGAPVNAANSISGTIAIDASGYSSGVIQSAGTNLTGDVPQDKDGITRSSTPWMGAYEGPVKDKDGTITPGGGTEPVTISSVIDTDGEKILVFDFSLDDLGTSDGLTTVIDSLEIIPGSANGVADWTKAIAGAELSGPDLPGGLSAIINPTSLGFRTGSPGIINIADGTSETYVLKIWLKTDLSNIADNDVLEFRISNTEIYNDNTKSGFTTGSEESGDGNNAIDITATELRFVTNKPPADVNTNNNFEVEVNATDENGNVDTDETSSITLAKLTGSGILSSASGLTQSLVAGNYYWNDVQYNTSETFTIEAQSATMTNASSISITAVFATVIAVGDGQTYNTIEDAYNTGIPATIAGPYIIELMSDYDATNEAPPITLGQKTGHSAANTITIRPAFGVSGTAIDIDPGLSVSIITFTDCEYVILDGRPGGIGTQRDWVIRNNRITGSAGHCLNFTGDARYITAKYLHLEAEPDPTNLGVIAFKGNGTNGCDFNTIDNCYIGDLTIGGSANRPSNGVGSQGPIGTLNDNNTITNCEIVDIFFTSGPSSQTSGIVITDNNDSWTITNNHFYQTADHPVNDAIGSFIHIMYGGGYLIDGNFMGGRAKNCGGSKYTISSGNGQFGFVIFDPTASGTANTISNNICSNMSLTSTFDQASYAFFGLNTDGSSDFNVQNNQIGSLTGSQDVILTNNGPSLSLGFNLIRNKSSGTATVSGNKLGGILLNGSRNSATSILIDNTAGTITVDNNIIGNSTNLNIDISSDSKLTAISNSSATGLTATNNTIQNIDQNASGNGFTGIDNTSGPLTCNSNSFKLLNLAGNNFIKIIDHKGTTATIDGNSFSDIICENTGGSAQLKVILSNSSSTLNVDNNVIGGSTANNMEANGDAQHFGIYYDGTGTLNASANTIQNFNLPSATSVSSFTGMYGSSGVSNFTNNTIHDISLASTSASTVGAIVIQSTGSSQIVSGNTVYNLFATNNTAVNPQCSGIQINAGDGLVEKNFIHSIETQATGASPLLMGINIMGGSWDYYNNVVRISNGANTNGVIIRAVNEQAPTGTTINFNHNTILVQGNQTSGSNPSSCYFRGAGGTDNVYNNVFQNTRTATGGKHHTFDIGNNTDALTQDFNYLENLVAGDLTMLTGTPYDLANWRTNTTATTATIDGAEVIDDNGYATASFVGSGAGTDLTATVPNDKDGNTRSVTPWMGAYEKTAPLCGTYTIGGASPDYTTFQSAVTALESGGITCPCKFKFRDGTYTEQVTIGNIGGINATDTVVFESENLDSSLVKISFTANVTNTFTLRLNNADRISFKCLGIEGLDATYSNAVLINGGSDYNRFERCKISSPVGSFATNELVTVFSDAGPNSYNSFIGNLINGGSYGIRLNSTAGNENMQTMIKNNTIQNYYYMGVFLSFNDSASIVENTVGVSGWSVGEAIKLSTCDQGVIVRDNVVVTTGNMRRSLFLFNCNGTAGSHNLIYNNFFQNGVGGICISVFLQGNYTDFYHNSVVTIGSNTSSKTLNVNTGTDVRIQNNLLVNEAGGYAYFVENSGVISVSDKNDIFSTGSNVGSWLAADQATLSDWKTASSLDANSVSIDPVLVSSTDLHLSGLSPASLQIGDNLNSVCPVDVDGTTRGSIPWLGAHEFIPNILYYYQNSGNWNDNTKWFNASNGVSPCTCVPDNTYDVIFDANSFTGGGQVITIPAGTHNAKSLDFQDPATQPAFKGSGSLIIGQ